MATHYVPNCTRVLVRYVSLGEDCENVYDFKYNTTPTVANLSALCTEVYNKIWLKMAVYMHTSSYLTQIVATDIGAAGRATYTLYGGPTQAGLRAGTPAPNNVALSVTTKTGTSGHGTHGSKRLGGMVGTDLNGDDVLSFLMNAALQVLIGYLQLYVSGQFAPALANVNTGALKLLVSGVIKDNSVDTQSTRLKGR